MTSLFGAIALLFIGALAAESDAGKSAILPEPPSAVGVLVNAVGENCSGTLIDDAVVLTAAHCLMEGDTDRLAFPKSFRVHDRETGDILTSTARSIVLPRGYDYLRWQDSEEINHLDWALVVLRDPLGARVGTIPVFALSHSAAQRAVSTGYGYVGFGASGGKSATVYRDCRVLTWSLDGTFTDNCGTVEGDSGGPAIAIRNGKAIIIGVISAELEGGDDLTVSSVAFADDVLAFLEDRSDPGGRAALVARRWTAPDSPTASPRTLASVFWNGRETAPWPSLSFTCHAGARALAFRPGIVPAITDLWHAPTVEVSLLVGGKPAEPIQGSIIAEGVLLSDDRLVSRLNAAAQASPLGTRRGAALQFTSAAGIATNVWFSLEGFRDAVSAFERSCPAPSAAP